MAAGRSGRALEIRTGLANGRFSFCNIGHIGNWPLDWAFRDIEIQDSNRLPEARLWRGRRKAVAFFLYLAEETEDAAKGHRQMVQPDQGLWVHQAERQ